MVKRGWTGLLLAWLAGSMALAAAQPAQAMAPKPPGVTDQTIVFGQVATLEGADGALGRALRLGVLAAFGRANRSGRLHGRLLALESFDDGGSVEAAAKRVKRLAKDQRVFALVALAGAARSALAAQAAARSKTPILGLPGAVSGRYGRAKSPDALTVTIGAGRVAEIRALVRRLCQEKEVTRVAILHRDNTAGRADLKAAEQALASWSLRPIRSAAYAPGTIAVKGALSRIRRAEPDAVLVLADHRPAAEFIRLFRTFGLPAALAAPSTVNGEALGPWAAGLIVSQPAPFPASDSSEVAVAYREALAAADADASPGYGSLAGYLMGRAAVLALQSDDALSQETFVAATARIAAADLGGVMVSLGVDGAPGDAGVFLTRVSADGRLQAIDGPGGS
jgi:ABC-type branched-subunit amino acid transport system substrate-binding protein